MNEQEENDSSNIKTFFAYEILFATKIFDTPIKCDYSGVMK